MKTNYNREMEKIISLNKGNGSKPSLLMHSCCAPCSTACIQAVKEHFDLTIYYYNPNIDTADEYSIRLNEQIRYCQTEGVKIIYEDYCKHDFLNAVKGLENEREGEARCSVCYALRLEQTAKKAKQLGFDYFTTTLTVSPLKDAERLNSIGKAIGEKLGVKFLPSDFKKKGGYALSVELSKKHNLYRQNYCGCEFSKNTRP